MACGWSNLPHLQATETYLRLQLDRVQQRVTEVEHWHDPPGLGVPLPPPDWTVQMNVSADPRPVAVHHGECTAGRRPRLRPVPRQGVNEALTAGVEPCALCRPDRELQLD
ncbi:DUF6233 domain-containing protein [Streptomyces sp. NPDC055299]